MDYVLLKKEDMQANDFNGGKVEYYANKELTGTDYTLGFCTISPGGQNPLHYHPNSDETLHVIKGKIIHSVKDENIEMTAGDTIMISAGIAHNARNIGDEEAVLAIAFSTGERKAVWV